MSNDESERLARRLNVLLDLLSDWATALLVLVVLFLLLFAPKAVFLLAVFISGAIFVIRWLKGRFR